jgi:hypothetical protein
MSAEAWLPVSYLIPICQPGKLIFPIEIEGKPGCDPKSVLLPETAS